MSKKLNDLEAKIDALESKLVDLAHEKQAAEQEAQQQVRSARRTHKRATYIVASTLATMVLVGAASYLMAQTVPPAPLTYSGYLEAGGKPVNGNRDIIVSLYDSQTSSSPQCSTGTKKSPISVMFVKGRFKVALSDGCKNEASRSSNLWIEVQIKEGNSFVPLSRTRLSPTYKAVKYPTVLGEAKFPKGSNVTVVNSSNATIDSNGYFVTNGNIALKSPAKTYTSWQAVSFACEASYGVGAYMCTDADVIRTAQLGKMPNVGTPEPWIAGGFAIRSPSGSNSYGINNCSSWQTNSTNDGGHYLVRTGFRFNSDRCNAKRTILCCR
ncbi:MAG: hypothetical protein EP343_11235 [Deltaproteobacteria bacterium]|nr:MAG: hypothetical protein EP343_11235 [Deltaproteobacteria bacterium]